MSDRDLSDRYARIRKALAMTEDLDDLMCPHSAAGRLERFPAKACILAGECGCVYGAEWSRALRPGQDQYLANGYFIAACDPDTIRELLAERDQLAAEIDALRAEVDEWKDMARCASEQQDSLFREALALNKRAERLAEALRDAATSMQTIADKAGRDAYLMTTDDVRGYANSRANAARAALEQGGRAPDGGRMTEHYELPRGDWPEFYLAEIVAQTNKRSLALAIRRELGEGYVITPGIDMLYAVRRLRKRPGGRTARLGRRK